MQENISKTGAEETWHYREAATLALGCILEGPRERSQLSIVFMGLPFLLKALQDTHEQVRSTTAWTIGKWAGACLGFHALQPGRSIRKPAVL